MGEQLMDGDAAGAVVVPACEVLADRVVDGELALVL